MPEAVILHPDGIFRRTDPKHALRNEVAKIVANKLDGQGYDNEPLHLVPDDVDVLLDPYQWEDVKLGSTFLLRIEGYDYPQRMDDIVERLDAITVDFTKFINELRRLMNLTSDDGMIPHIGAPGQKLVSVRFYPIQKGCWTVSDE